MITDALFRKQEDLATTRKKIQTSREGRVIDPAAIAKTPATPAVPYPDKTAATYPDDVAATYPDETAATYPDKAANLSELKNQRGVRLSRPETSKRLRPFINHYQNNWSHWLPAMDFAQATLPHKSTGISPYKLELGFPARQSFDWQEHQREYKLTGPETMSTAAAREYARRYHGA